LDGDLAAVALQGALDPEGEAGGHAGHDVVEVVAVDLDELALLEGLERGGGVAGEVAQDADDEGELRLDLGPLGLDLVGDMDAGLADPLQLVMDARTARHVEMPPFDGER